MLLHRAMIYGKNVHRLTKCITLPWSIKLHSFFISTTHFGGRVTGAYEKSKKLESFYKHQHHSAYFQFWCLKNLEKKFFRDFCLKNNVRIDFTNPTKKKHFEKILKNVDFIKEKRKIVLGLLDT